MDRNNCTTLMYPYSARNPNKTEQYSPCFVEETVLKMILENLKHRSTFLEKSHRPFSVVVC